MPINQQINQGNLFKYEIQNQLYLKILYDKIIINLFNKERMSNNPKTVDLQKLVEHPTSLKLLILHTPFTLEISSLWRCTNLIKLDLSKNNLQNFPHIGNLVNLKFMFLHQNKLNHKTLKGIFFSEDQPMYSPLSKSIIWVTFWGNKNVFFARHFLVTQTSVMAVDNYMVVPQQRKFSVIQSSVQPFSEQTDIAYILENKLSLSKNATEEEYMDQFWQEMRQLKLKIQEICPIIKIQKIFRGWILRKRLYDSKKNAADSLEMKTNTFNGWKKQVLRNKKLQLYLKRRNKQHFLLPLKQMKLQSIKRKMLQWAGRAKKRVLVKKISLNKQVRFYHILRSNMLMFRSFYNELQVQKSSFLMIDSQSFRQVQSTIRKFISLFHKQQTFLVVDNECFTVRQVKEGASKNQFARFLSINRQSYVVRVNNVQRHKQTYVRSLLNQNICFLATHSTLLKPLYKNENKTHFSNAEKSKMKKNSSQMQKLSKLMLGDFLIIKASHTIMKDFIRCSYYINTRAIKIDDKKFISDKRKIKIFSQQSIKKLSSVTIIQKFWRGYIFRKKQKQNAQICAKQYRAVVKLQRWIRNLPQRKKYIFRNEIARILKTFNDPFFFVKMSDYLKAIQSTQIKKQDEYQKMKMIEQNLSPYFNLVSKKITLFWNPEQGSKSKFNETVKSCFQIKKNPFNRFFISSLFKSRNLNQLLFDPTAQNQPSNADIQKGQFSHLFHFNTLTSLSQKQNVSWIKITCNTVEETKLRVMGILLKSYSFKNGFGIKLYPYERIDFQKYFKKNILNNESIFVTKGDVFLKQNAEKIKTFTFKSRIYMKESINLKPTKLQEIMLIFVQNTKEQNADPHSKISQSIEIKLENSKTKTNKTKLYIDQMYFSDAASIMKTEGSQINPIKASIKKQQMIRSSTQRNECFQQGLKRVLPLKKQIKRFKVEKRQKKREPSFILDNVSKNQRITTQPDLHNNQHFQTEKSEQSLVEYSSVKQNLKKKFIYRRNLVKSQKLDNSFHQNFVNLNNFLQQQGLSEQRRRVKTQLQMSAYESADRIRVSLQKSASDLLKHKQGKMKRVERDIKTHKQTLQKHRLIKQQQKQQFQRVKSMQRQKKQQNNQHYVRRLKVSFAEQCFPIVNRSANNLKSNNQSFKKVDSNRQNQKYMISASK